MLARVPHAIVANSREAAGFGGNRLTVISNGIDTERFRREAERGRAWRRRLGLPESGKVVGRIGRVDPLKDIPTFLAAAARVARARDDVHFVCVGRGPSGSSRHAVWVGEQSDIVAVYSALDLLVSTSVTEGFPNVIGEAMACGVPCVATNVGASALVVGDTGTVVPPRDPEAVAHGILDQLANPADAARVRQRIVMHFGVDAMLARTEAGLAGRSES